MLAEYPGTTVVRLFRTAGQGLPSWTSGQLGDVPIGTHIILSWKDWPADVEAWLDAMPSARQGTVTLCYHHEPEQQTGGDPTPAAFIDAWEELVAQIASHPRRSWIKLAPIYTRYWAAQGGNDWHDFWPSSVASGIDAVGWDVYNPGNSSYTSPATLLDIVADVQAETGKPLIIGEWGAERITGDTTGSGAVAWMEAFAAELESMGCLAACWFHVGGDDLISESRTAEKTALEDLIAGSGESGGSSGGSGGSGSGSSGDTPADTLALWSATSNAELSTTFFDAGQVARGSSADLKFRVRNRSASYTATDVTVTVYDTGIAATPSVAAMHLLSTDGQSFAANVDLGDLAAGATSGTLTLRRTVPSDADLGDWTFAITATPTGWE